MENRRCRLVWTKRSQQQMLAAYKYISQDSEQNAEKVLNDIVTAMEKAVINPGFYGPDKYKTDNDVSYRAFEKHHYRVIYRYAKNIIRVLRVRHTRMEPKMY
jgi:plasmid stabilization system protein ParE